HEAGKLYRLRRKRCRPAFKLDNKGLRQILQSRLEEGWSPEQIKGRESLEVSVTTIYRAVKSGRLPFEVRKHLRRKGKPYRRKTRQDGRGRIKDAVSIELRPKEVEQRLEIGNWEVDTVLGKPGSGGLVTVVDRTSRLLLAAKIEDKTASRTTERSLLDTRRYPQPWGLLCTLLILTVPGSVVQTKIPMDSFANICPRGSIFKRCGTMLFYGL
ncbi:IS30 family transposase, partial [Fretibacterium sp. OH1220_COT-178]|uniref:IS30 family transposase n=1 Tax=Fretibacterium sp. OH1220_COT-178 TaxID=2491047 RepID=UPI000F5FEE0D